MEKTYLYLIIGVLAGVIVGVFLAQNAVNTGNTSMMNMMGMRSGMQLEENNMMSGNTSAGMGHMDESMNQMSSLLATLRGEEFDREFIVRMIDHHQGAIDMAELVLMNSDRAELKELANDIISAQSKEIEMMKSWLDEWF